MNCYPREYLELWEIKEEIARSTEEAKQIKQTWKALNYQVAARTISFSDLARCSIIKLIGLKDKTNTKTTEEIKKELKTLF
jgi:hypothetical protein